ncbi:MAG TPA: type Z 30S ribosomal protein S14 [Polyangiaceae bacterium]|nr:type Z 30S ribosomal protein S14 [Polyangiaceae bacterium]HMR73747.1 type Z 30S ribosomal protein S14 [Polyangiaceae bacterium]
MARASQWAKLNRVPKFSTRANSRCQVCGRSRAYYRDFKLCRICLRLLGLKGELPGLTKASW